MSGGHFDYSSWTFESIADEIQEIIDTNEYVTCNEYGEMVGHFYPAEIIEKFKLTVNALRRLRKQVHHIDYLLSGDYGEDTFLKRWKDDLS